MSHVSDRHPYDGDFARDATCPRCKGKKVENLRGTVIRCAYCDGSGEVTLDDAKVYLDVMERTLGAYRRRR